MIEAQDHSLGQVSQVLEAKLRAGVRKHGILVWRDLNDHYSGLVDALILFTDTRSRIRLGAENSDRLEFDPFPLSPARHSLQVWLGAATGRLRSARSRRSRANLRA